MSKDIKELLPDVPIWLTDIFETIELIKDKYPSLKEMIILILKRGIEYHNSISELRPIIIEKRKITEKEGMSQLEKIEQRVEQALTRRDHYSDITDILVSSAKAYRETYWELRDSLQEISNPHSIPSIRELAYELKLLTREFEKVWTDSAEIRKERRAKILGQAPYQFFAIRTTDVYLYGKDIRDVVDSVVEDENPTKYQFILYPSAGMDIVNQETGYSTVEDRCYVLGVTIQHGMNGVDNLRFKSVNRKYAVRSLLWHKWITRYLELLKASTEDLASHFERIGQIDPYMTDYFVRCTYTRDVMHLTRDRVATNGLNKQMTAAITETLQTYSNFPFVGQADDALIDYVTYGEISIMMARLLTKLEREYTTKRSKSNLSEATCGLSEATCGLSEATCGLSEATCGLSEATCGLSEATCGLRKVALWMEDGIEWVTCDIACALVGIVPVGLHTHWPITDVIQAIKAIEPDVIIAQNSSFVEQLSTIELKHNPHFLLVEDLIDENIFEEVSEEVGEDKDEVSTLQAVLKLPLYRKTIENPTLFTIDKQRVFTIMFTSGTTAGLKGVEVSTKTWLTDFFFRQQFSLDPVCVVSYYALANALDRGQFWQSFFNGGRVSFAIEVSPEQLRKKVTEKVKALCDEATCQILDEEITYEIENIVPPPSVLYSASLANPSHFVSAPDIWTGLITLLQSTGVVNKLLVPRRRLTEELLRSSDDYSKSDTTLACIDNTLKKIRTVIFGTNLKAALTGAAPLSQMYVDLLKDFFGFSAMDGKVNLSHVSPFSFLNVYGAVEAESIATDGKVRTGIETHICPVEGYDLSIGQGELWVKGHGVAQRYYNNPEASSTAFVSGGWYRTGDVVWYRNGELTVIERVKNLLELYDGSISIWVSPTEIEDILRLSLAELFAERDSQKDVPPPKYETQLAVFSNRMLNQPVAVLAVDPSLVYRFLADEVVVEPTKEKDLEFLRLLLECTILDKFAEQLKQNGKPDYWAPAEVLLYLIIDPKGEERGHPEVPSWNRDKYELVKSVVPDQMEPWTVHNGLLTTLGKLRRGILQKNILTRLNRSFADVKSGRVVNACRDFFRHRGSKKFESN